ncbi:MAG TPA: hypothetical protein VM260_05895 [Pirellula sp.]|nr:hypothetical protein [Pirellula sp.]
MPLRKFGRIEGGRGMPFNLPNAFLKITSNNVFRNIQPSVERFFKTWHTLLPNLALAADIPIVS